MFLVVSLRSCLFTALGRIFSFKIRGMRFLFSIQFPVDPQIHLVTERSGEEKVVLWGAQTTPEALLLQISPSLCIPASLELGPSL